MEKDHDDEAGGGHHAHASHARGHELRPGGIIGDTAVFPAHAVEEQGEEDAVEEDETGEAGQTGTSENKSFMQKFISWLKGLF